MSAECNNHHLIALAAGYNGKPVRQEQSIADRFLKILQAIGLLFTISLFTACTSATLTSPPDSQVSEEVSQETPIAEQIGSEGTVIGLIVANEPNNFSNGAPNSVYLASKLAVKSLKDVNVKIIVRRYENTQSSIKQAASAFIDAKVQIVIGPEDSVGTSSMAAFLAGHKIPILSLGEIANPKLQIYRAGVQYLNETNAIASQMKKLKYRSVIIAQTSNTASKSYASKLNKAIRRQGIKVSMQELENPDKSVTSLQERIKKSKKKPDAIAFATDPETAIRYMTLLQNDPAMQGIAMVGNSGWSIAEPKTLSGLPNWYMATAKNKLSDFSKKFAAAWQKQPTIRSAIVYDLIVMAGVLAKFVPDNTFASRVITNPQGFQGQTGPFKFRKNGNIQRSYVTVGNN